MTRHVRTRLEHRHRQGGRRPGSVRTPRGDERNALLHLQRLAGNRAVAHALGPQQRLVQRACCASCAGGGVCEREADTTAAEHATRPGAPSVAAGELEVQRQAAGGSSVRRRSNVQSPLMTVQRYYTEDCEDYDANQRRTGVGIAMAIATRAYQALLAYLHASMAPSAGPKDPQTAKLLRECFASDSASVAGTAFLRFGQIKRYLDANDFTVECEDDCDGSNAYVYCLWSDLHMCMNAVKNLSARRYGEILLHEVSHDAAGTDDEQYFYPPSGATTSLSSGDALDNADSYESFAAQI